MTSTPARSGMPEHFGIRVTDAQKERLVGELDVDDRHLNNSGHVHGGALAAFADDLGGRLVGLNVPPAFRTTPIESKTNIFRACVPGRLTGVAVPVHVGRRMIVLQISIHRSDGKLAAMMRCSGPRRPLPFNDLASENRGTAGRIGEVRLARNIQGISFDRSPAAHIPAENS
jgi:1,4-dihydroxy-2-naphthoyl-CoA hydrolase